MARGQAGSERRDGGRTGGLARDKGGREQAAGRRRGTGWENQGSRREGGSGMGFKRCEIRMIEAKAGRCQVGLTTVGVTYGIFFVFCFFISGNDIARQDESRQGKLITGPSFFFFFFSKNLGKVRHLTRGLEQFLCSTYYIIHILLESLEQIHIMQTTTIYYAILCYSVNST